MHPNSVQSLAELKQSLKALSSYTPLQKAAFWQAQNDLGLNWSRLIWFRQILSEELRFLELETQGVLGVSLPSLEPNLQGIHYLSACIAAAAGVPILLWGFRAAPNQTQHPKAQPPHAKILDTALQRQGIAYLEVEQFYSFVEQQMPYRLAITELFPTQIGVLESLLPMLFPVQTQAQFIWAEQLSLARLWHHWFEQAEIPYTIWYNCTDRAFIHPQETQKFYSEQQEGIMQPSDWQLPALPEAPNTIQDTQAWAVQFLEGKIQDNRYTLVLSNAAALIRRQRPCLSWAGALAEAEAAAQRPAALHAWQSLGFF